MNKIKRMDRLGMGTMAAFALAGAVACSNSSTPAPTEAGTSDAASADESTDAGTTTATLTVMNFLSWCSVTVNGGAASAAASMTTAVADGSTATIVAMPASSSFEIGADPWFGVTENAGGAAAGTDNGTGATETTTATVVITGDHCVSVCCELPGNSPTPCPTTNPCP
jgi:hypothetical protein